MAGLASQELKSAWRHYPCILIDTLCVNGAFPDGAQPSRPKTQCHPLSFKHTPVPSDPVPPGLNQDMSMTGLGEPGDRM